jgi:diguanylate cyclase (GGDEF)-like protein
MNPGRWEHIAEVYAELGMLPHGYSLDGFLFDPNVRPEPLRSYLIAVAVALAALLGIAIWRVRVSLLRRSNAGIVATRAQQDQIRDLRAQLQTQGMRDVVTGLYNRGYLEDALAREIARARHRGGTVSLLALAIDDLGGLADTYGSHAREAILVALAKEIRERAQAEDLPCRESEETFVWVMPGTGATEASGRAETLKQTFASLRVRSGPFEIGGTLAFGLAAFPDDAKDAGELLAVALRALRA